MAYKLVMRGPLIRRHLKIPMSLSFMVSSTSTRGRREALLIAPLLTLRFFAEGKCSSSSHSLLILRARKGKDRPRIWNARLSLWNFRDFELMRIDRKETGLAPGARSQQARPCSILRSRIRGLWLKARSFAWGVKSPKVEPWRMSPNTAPSGVLAWGGLSLGGITCPKLLVKYGLICFMCLL